MTAQRSNAAWTTALATRLLEALSPEGLAELAQAHAVSANPAVSPAKLRRELLARAAQSTALQRAIRQSWRNSRTDLVAATQLVHLVTSDVTQQCEALAAHFSLEDILLELLTDEHDDGWQLSRELLAEIRGENLRQRLESLLAAWTIESPPEKLARVVIFGGHPRDESRLGPLFASGPFELRWRTLERRQGDSVDRGQVVDALASADAAIIVTGMASHNIMDLARGHAKACGLRWRCIEKATHGQIATALSEMFPDLAGATA
jgi:hypothetical protein